MSPQSRRSIFFGVIAARQQQAYQPIVKDAPPGVFADVRRLVVVAAVLAAAIVVNVIGQTHHGSVLDRMPAIGLAVWAVLLLCAPLVAPDWRVLPRRCAAASS